MQTNNPILKIIYDTMQTEITNRINATPHSIQLTLPNEAKIIIGAIMTTAPLYIVPPFSIRTNKTHTYHFLHQSNDTNQSSRLTLLSMEDCRSYLDDVCQTLLNATFHDFEITFPDGSTYLILVTQMEK